MAWPAAQRKARTVVLVLVISHLVVDGGDGRGRTGCGGLPGACSSFFSLNRWFLPTTFQVNEKSA